MKIQDFDFKPRCPPEVLAKARKWLVDKRENFSNVTNFAIFVTDGSKYNCLNQPCHREMMYTAQKYPSTNGNRECIATEVGAHRLIESGVAAKAYPELTVETYRPYVMWLVNESPMGRFILNRDDIDECLNYGLVISSDIPTAVMQNILISARYVFEANPGAFLLFNRMLKEGHPGSFAYNTCLGSTLADWGRVGSLSKPPQRLKGAEIAYPATSHRSWGLFQNVSSFEKFASGDWGTVTEHDADGNRRTAFVEKNHYRHYASIYGGIRYCEDPMQSPFTAQLAKEETFLTALRTHRGDDAKGPIIDNPFAIKSYGEVQKKPYHVTADELVEVVLPYMQEKGSFKNVCC